MYSGRDKPQQSTRSNRTLSRTDRSRDFGENRHFRPDVGPRGKASSADGHTQLMREAALDGRRMRWEGPWYILLSRDKCRRK